MNRGESAAACTCTHPGVLGHEASCHDYPFAAKPRAEMALRSEIARLRRENARLRSLDCRTCSGAGAIEGFLLGTVKTCPACRGRGIRGR